MADALLRAPDLRTSIDAERGVHNVKLTALIKERRRSWQPYAKNHAANVTFDDGSRFAPCAWTGDPLRGGDLFVEDGDREGVAAYTSRDLGMPPTAIGRGRCRGRCPGGAAVNRSRQTEV